MQKRSNASANALVLHLDNIFLFQQLNTLRPEQNEMHFL